MTEPATVVTTACNCAFIIKDAAINRNGLSYPVDIFTVNGDNHLVDITRDFVGQIAIMSNRNGSARHRSCVGDINIALCGGWLPLRLWVNPAFRLQR